MKKRKLGDGGGWREVEPGIFSREVPKEERRVSVGFLNQLIGEAQGALRRVLVETKARLLENGKSVQ